MRQQELRKTKIKTKKEWRELHKSVSYCCNVYNNIAKTKEGAALFNLCKAYGLVTEKGKADMNTRHFFKIDATFYKVVGVQKKYHEALLCFVDPSEEEMATFAVAKDGGVYRLAPVTKFSIENLIELAYAGKVLEGARIFDAPLSLSRPPKEAKAEKPASFTETPAEKVAAAPAASAPAPAQAVATA